MAPPRSDLCERLQDESARAQAGVREDRVGRGLDAAPEVQNVDIDLAGTVDERRRSADLQLNVLDRLEETRGLARPRDLGDEVPELGLVRVADGIGSVERGDALEGSEP